MLNRSVIFASEGANKLVAGLRAVAIAFGKQHKHVLRTIAAKLANPDPEIGESARSNSGPRSYLDAQGQARPMYRLTCDCLIELAMGFSGDAAAKVRICFIAAFREVSRRLADAERLAADRLSELQRPRNLHDLRAAQSELRGTIGSRPMDDVNRCLHQLRLAATAGPG